MNVDVEEVEARLCLADASACPASAMLFAFGALDDTAVASRITIVCVILGAASAFFVTAWITHRRKTRRRTHLAGTLVKVWWWALAGTVTALTGAAGIVWWACGAHGMLERVLAVTALFLTGMSIKHGRQVLRLTGERLAAIYQR